MNISHRLRLIDFEKGRLPLRLTAGRSILVLVQPMRDSFSKGSNSNPPRGENKFKTFENSRCEESLMSCLIPILF